MTELARIRRALFVILVVALGGTLAELLLLEHFGDAWQFAPLVLIPIAVSLLTWHEVSGSSRSRHALTVVMGLAVLAGPLGVFLHYRGNMEFEREMNPAIGGFPLIREALMGATPALAPGTMSMFGLVGLTYLYVAARSRSRR